MAVPDMTPDVGAADSTPSIRPLPQQALGGEPNVVRMWPVRRSRFRRTQAAERAVLGDASLYENLGGDGEA
jgi:hypothetical protein